jgi:hypothetical protein
LFAINPYTVELARQENLREECNQEFQLCRASTECSERNANNFVASNSRHEKYIGPPLITFGSGVRANCNNVIGPGNVGFAHIATADDDTPSLTSEKDALPIGAVARMGNWAQYEQRYYYNTVTGASTWDCPSSFSTTAARNWVEYVNHYYGDLTTGEKTRDCPPEFDTKPAAAVARDGAAGASNDLHANAGKSNVVVKDRLVFD